MSFGFLSLAARSFWLEAIINYILGVLEKYLKKKIKAYGQLVLLGFSVTTFTPVAYQRHSL